jgi:hypothetical protein
VSRIFYFTGHRLTVFHWNRKTFSGACSFEPDTEGLDKFRQYLETSENTPTKFLVDVIEEDFRIESIPHVYGKDRKAILTRQMDRYYRSSNQYVYAEVIGRKKTGRKDDDVLIGGITNPYLIQPWVGIIQESGATLSGIWTLPILSKQLLPVVGVKQGPVLLVSQQVNSNLRQTFFRDGKMLSSRQSVINQDAADISNIGNFAQPEVERTTEFLRNQRLIGVDEVIQVHVLGSNEQLASLEAAFVSNPLSEIHIHKISDIHEKLGLKDLSGKFSDELFAWLCKSQLGLNSHYGEPKEYKQYYYTLGSAALYAMSVVMALSALLVTESNIESTIEHEKAVELLSTQAREYKQVYKKKFEAYETVFTHARSMNAAVDLADRIYRNSRISPLDFMVEVSDVLSRSGLSSIHIDKIEWATEQYKDNQGIKEVALGLPDVTSEDPIQHVGILKGRINISDENYRGSVAQVNKIVLALLQHKRIEEVEAIDMPVEVRPERSFGDELEVDSGESKGAFSLKIKMKAPDRA